jgi:hypothetical protein
MDHCLSEDSGESEVTKSRGESCKPPELIADIKWKTLKYLEQLIRMDPKRGAEKGFESKPEVK